MRAWWGVTPPPRDWDERRWSPRGDWYYERRTYPVPKMPSPAVDEERVRKIVREEIADLPIPFDVPDAPPEQS
jgi:hypothetical protein